MGDTKGKQEDIASKAKEADRWLRPAAMSGYGPAMYSLGVLDLKYNKKVESALQWLEKAKNAGHEQAKIEFDAVRELRGNAEKKQARTLAATGKEYVGSWTTSSTFTLTVGKWY